MSKSVVYQYYKLRKNLNVNSFELSMQGFELKVVQPHNGMHNILWTLFSMGRFKEYRILNNSKIIAYAQIMPKIFIFDFMDKNGLHIGPCWTHPDFRGQGIYPYLLRKIVDDDYGSVERADKYYIFTSTDNISSQKGIEKAGGEIFAYGYKTKLGIYRLSSYNKPESE
jgi:GNAT superfamily N-acetyltransferase